MSIEADKATERETPVETFLIEAVCDDCHTGTLVFDGHSYTTFRTYYSHICDNCGVKKVFGQSYPYTMHKKSEGKQ